MLYEIIIEREARNYLDSIAITLKEYYPSTYYKFMKNFNSKLEILKVFPYSYQLIYNSNYRRIQLMYRYQIIYTVKENQIIISEITFPQNK